MDAREITWKPYINPKADFASVRTSKEDVGDVVTDEGVCKRYQLNSCLRPYLLSKTSIRYSKTAQKGSCDVRASYKRARIRPRVTIDSIAACARKQGVRCVFDSENWPRKSQNCTLFQSWACS